MHGRPTFVPGSWAAGGGRKRAVQPVAVSAQVNAAASANETDDIALKARLLARECAVCRDERRSKCIVARGADGDRFLSLKFLTAAANFANSDLNTRRTC